MDRESAEAARIDAHESGNGRQTKPFARLPASYSLLIRTATKPARSSRFHAQFTVPTVKKPGDLPVLPCVPYNKCSIRIAPDSSGIVKADRTADNTAMANSDSVV